jgi:hypothetical protein
MPRPVPKLAGYAPHTSPLFIAAVLGAAMLASACRDEGPAESSAPRETTTSATASSSANATSRASRTPELPPPPALPADEAPPPPPASPPPKAPPLSEAQLATFFATPSQKITAEVFETVLLRLETCTIEPGWVERCPAYGDLMKVVQRYRGGEGFPGEPALRHLRHPSFAVRATAASFASQHAFGKERTPDREARYLEAMRSETDVEMLESLVRHAASGASRNPAILRFVLRSLGHADARVRRAALAALGSPDVAPDVPDALLYIAPATKADRPLEERVSACAALGNVDDERVVAWLGAMLADDSLPLELHGACFEALVGTWMRHPSPKAPSREGYELTLRLLRAKPRPRAMAHSRGLRAIGSAGGPVSFLPKDAQGFYDVREVSEALAALALDDEAYAPARTEAGRSLVRLGQASIIDATLSALKKQGTASATTVATEMEKRRSDADDPFGRHF